MRTILCWLARRTIGPGLHDDAALLSIDLATATTAALLTLSLLASPRAAAISFLAVLTIAAAAHLVAYSAYRDDIAAWLARAPQPLAGLPRNPDGTYGGTP